MVRDHDCSLCSMCATGELILDTKLSTEPLKEMLGCRQSMTRAQSVPVLLSTDAGALFGIHEQLASAKMSAIIFTAQCSRAPTTSFSFRQGLQFGKIPSVSPTSRD